MSEFHVQVVKLEHVEKHPNADTLSIAKVNGDYPVIFKTGEFQPGGTAVYVPVDAVVPDTPEWSFLNGHRRIRAKRLRGIFSMGLLAPAKTAWKVGQNVQHQLGITKYEPPPPGGHGKNLLKIHQDEKGYPTGFDIYTDIEGLRRWPNVLRLGEAVVIMEKIHGCNARYVYSKGRLWVGSHHRVPARPKAIKASWWAKVWAVILATTARVARRLGSNRLNHAESRAKAKAKALDRAAPKNSWWRVADDYRLEEKLSRYPNIVLYGEVYGAVQDLHYGVPTEEVRFVAFDAKDIKTGAYLTYHALTSLCRDLNIPMAPVLYHGPWSDSLRKLAEGKTTMKCADHVREGFVVRPVFERHDPKAGRVIFKLVGEGYLLRKEG